MNHLIISIMGIYETLCRIADEAQIGSSCQGSALDVELKAMKKGIYGRRIRAMPIAGKEVFRVNKYDAVRVANWHEIWCYNGFVVDIDSPGKVYRIEIYREECFRFPENIELVEVEEA